MGADVRAMLTHHCPKLGIATSGECTELFIMYCTDLYKLTQWCLLPVMHFLEHPARSQGCAPQKKAGTQAARGSAETRAGGAQSQGCSAAPLYSRMPALPLVLPHRLPSPATCRADLPVLRNRV